MLKYDLPYFHLIIYLILKVEYRLKSVVCDCIDKNAFMLLCYIFSPYLLIGNILIPLSPLLFHSSLLLRLHTSPFPFSISFAISSYVSPSFILSLNISKNTAIPLEICWLGHWSWRNVRQNANHPFPHRW